jgi:hypothetical protein
LPVNLRLHRGSTPDFGLNRIPFGLRSPISTPRKIQSDASQKKACRGQ